MPLGKTIRRVGSMRLVGAFALALASVSASLPARADAGFQNWIASFRSVAADNGIKGSTYDRAFAGVTKPDPVVLEKARFQPEFKDENWNYFDNRVNDASIAEGRAMARKWADTLARIEKAKGVDAQVLLAIWSMESNYGRILENMEVMRPVVRSLATLAYADKKRAKFARTQLIAALKILQSGDITLDHLMGSWAGAMGHTQFIPTSFLAYRSDFDGNGHADIWESVPDALATAANLLRENGWRSGHAWGYEVILPEGRKFPNGKRSLADWAEMGVKRADGKPFPRPGDSADLKVPDGRGGPAFLVLNNFQVLKRYNNADKYAFAVGLLADAIASGRYELVNDWKRPFTKLSWDQKIELQQRLAQKGLYEGEFDGKIGSGSRKAIMAWQAMAGLPQDGHPSMEVLNSLK
ncbi:MAG: lytic murein transglycosylase [Rhizobiaceae bacterium]|nr:lytic murein transglycosylase [Rhizobiaceae bacterium]